ncbi:MAG: hypothetical protein HRU70_11735 [Phycisphaeraceae bacterium]|nr:MAG: hypothetical protein HRU70_11735 [Phycisphaeraceae bacterium]
MQRASIITVVSVLSLLAAAASQTGCEKKPEPVKAGGPAATPTGTDTHGHSAGMDHGHGPTTALGEQTAGGFTVKASRDGGISPGGDAPIDVWVTGGSAKVAAVRFWIGTQDAKGSLKAKAELEKDNWHTHAEVPSPLPEGSKLWVEVESDSGETTLVGFDLKM